MGGGEVVSGADRLLLLARSRAGAGFTVVTGPLGRDYWGLASVEVQVTVWPDDYDWKDRYNVHEWSLIAAGLEASEAKALARSHLSVGKVPTQRHRRFQTYLAAQELQGRLQLLEAVEPLVVEDVPFDLLTIDEGLELLDVLVESQELAALDWEWHRKTQAPVGLAISVGERNYYVPVWASDVDNRGRGLELQAAFERFVSSGGRAVLHNGRADLGTQVPGDPAVLGGGIDDTIVMAYLLGETTLGLKPLTKKYLGRDPIENDYEWAEQPARFTGRYAAAGDTRNTLALYGRYDGALQGSQREVYERIERPLIPVIASMEKYGTPVSISAVIRQYNLHVRIETGLRRAVQQHYGRDLASDQETRRFIVDQGFTDPGTLDQRVISLNPHWCIDLILAYRQTRTRRRNFLAKVLRRWVEAGKPRDFRVYPRFNQAGSMQDNGPSAPRTGRLSSADPNLMNQPRDIRDIYVPPEGCVWWSYDYSGLELRIAAGLSQDPVMLGALTEGRDLHGEFQEFIRLKTGKDVGRVPAKTGNFEQLYEGGANQLVRILAKQRAFVTGADAQVIVDSHQQLFSRYHQWGREVVAEARGSGYSSTLYGRMRKITEYDSDDAADIAHGDRAAQNHPVQGTGADIVKQAMVRLAREVLPRYGAHLSLQVHDELDGWVRSDVDLVRFDKDVREVLESYEVNGLRLKVEGGFGSNWAEAH